MAMGFRLKVSNMLKGMNGPDLARTYKLDIAKAGKKENEETKNEPDCSIICAWLDTSVGHLMKIIQLL